MAESSGMIDDDPLDSELADEEELMDEFGISANDEDFDEDFDELWDAENPSGDLDA